MDAQVTAGEDAAQSRSPREGATRHRAATEDQIEHDWNPTQPDMTPVPREEKLPSRKQWITAASAFAMVLLALTIANVYAPKGVTIFDRILLSSFVVFVSGFAVLLVLFVVMTILGRINLAQALEDKAPTSPNQGISLARLQAFLWTLVILTTYFYQAVSHRGEGLPAVPSDLLMVMGISSAVYLTSKNMNKGGGKA